jgi:hypothetical protein
MKITNNNLALPAMHDNRLSAHCVQSSETMTECQQFSGIFRYTVIRPGYKMILGDLLAFAILGI